MKIEERSYSGQLFRPRPEVYCDDRAGLAIVATPWGHRSAAKRAIQSLQDHFLARSDQESTSPFQTLSCLSPLGNNLRVALMLANDAIYKEENRDQYHSGVELFVAAHQQQECAWAVVGAPHVFLDRPGLDLIGLESGSDLSAHFSDAEKIFPPLPHNLLGVAPTSNFSVRSMHVQPLDQLVLLSRTLVPPRLLVEGESRQGLARLSQLLANNSPNMPFWLGILKFD